VKVIKKTLTLTSKLVVNSAGQTYTNVFFKCSWQRRADHR